MNPNDQPDNAAPVSTLDTDPVQSIAEDLLAKPKKKRLLSERQKDALKRGREIRWMKRTQEGTEQEGPPPSYETEKQNSTVIPELRDPRLQALLDPNTSSSESDSDNESSEDNSHKKHKAKKLKKSIPKVIRRHLDKYLRMKMQDVKQLAQQEREAKMRFDNENEEDDIPPPPLLRREQAVYRHPGYNHPLSFLWLYKNCTVC